MYSEKIAAEWGTAVYPLVIKPTMKELQLSKGAVWKNTLDEKSKVVSDFGDYMARKTGIKPKGTHFKMEVQQGKIGMKEIHVIYAKDDDSLNDFTRRVTMMAIPVKAAKTRK